MTNTPKQTISSEVDYDKGYRFRLWVTAVEDSATLGMGFNAYHSHILRSLGIWQHQGVCFIYPNDKQINFDALTKDDLFGFLGKKNSNMTGPGRNIKNFKLAVLDVFLKFKFPKLLPFFRNSDHATSLRAAMFEFHNSRQPQGWESHKVNKLFENGNALFIHNPKADDIFDLNAGLDVDFFEYYIQIYHLSLRDQSGTINVKKIRVPIHQNMLRKESEAYDLISKKALKYDYMEGIKIYEGFGITCEYKGEYGYQSDIACVLRERLLHHPFYQTLFPTMILNGADGNFFGSVIEFNFHNTKEEHILCSDRKTRYRNKDWIYNDKFINDIKSLIKRMGSEV